MAGEDNVGERRHRRDTAALGGQHRWQRWQKSREAANPARQIRNARYVELNAALGAEAI